MHSNTKANRRERKAGPQTRLSLPSISADESKDDVLKSLIETWLAPRLVEAFVRERAANLLTPKEEDTDQDAINEKFRAAA